MLQSLFRRAVDFIVPPRKTERIVRQLRLTDLESCTLRSLGEGGLPYHDPRVQALVWEVKYYANPSATRLAGAYLAEVVLAAASEELGVPLLIPVPMHTKRRLERGHNQTELLSRAVLSALRSSQSGARPVEYRPACLERITYTPTQQGLERITRLQNIKNSMRASRVAGRACIVLDDVTTTGATFEECRRALRAAGARSVTCIALARS